MLLLPKNMLQSRRDSWCKIQRGVGGVGGGGGVGGVGGVGGGGGGGGVGGGGVVGLSYSEKNVNIYIDTWWDH